MSEGQHRPDPTNELLRDDSDAQYEQSGPSMFDDMPDFDQPARRRPSVLPDDMFDTVTNPFADHEGATQAEPAGSAAGARGGRRAGRTKTAKVKPAKGKTSATKAPKDAGAPDVKPSAAAKALGYFGFGGGADGASKGKGRSKDGLKLTRRNSAVKFIIGLLSALVVFNLILLAMVNGKASSSQVAAEVKRQNAEAGKGYPKGAAVQFAGQVLRVWGTWDEDNPGAHQTYLTPYLSMGMDEQGGWNGKGKQQVQYASMNPEPVVVDKNRAIVSGSYQIQDGSWRCVAIPVFAYHSPGTTGASQWAFALSGNPSPVPCLPRTGADTVENYTLGSNLEEDDTVNRALQDNFFPGFMSAWGASDTDGMNQYAVPGLTLTGLGGSVASSPRPSIGDVHLFFPSGSKVQPNTTYQAVVTPELEQAFT